MDRPEDFDREIWINAMAASTLVFDRLLDEGRIAVISVQAKTDAAVPIARALLKAREEAFEEVAKIAEEWEGPEQLLPMAGIEANNGAAAGMYEASERIASAIRLHSQKGER